MENFEKVSDERKREVLSTRYQVFVIDRQDEKKIMKFDCGVDLMFFLSFVNLNLYKVLIYGAYTNSDRDL